MDTTQLARRNALALLVAGTVGGVLAACQGIGQASVAATPVTSGPAPTATATAAPQPQAGGTHRAGIQTDLPNTDPYFTSPSNYDALWIAFDRLISLDTHLEPQPMLAESRDVSSDLTQVRFNLRKGVQFHSGREFTSDDVKYNLLHVRDPKVGAGSLAAFSNWWAIDTPDKYTVVLKSDSPRPLLWDYFEYLNIVDSQVTEGPDSQTKVAAPGRSSLLSGRRATTYTSPGT